MTDNKTHEEFPLIKKSVCLFERWIFVKVDCYDLYSAEVQNENEIYQSGVVVFFKK